MSLPTSFFKYELHAVNAAGNEYFDRAAIAIIGLLDQCPNGSGHPIADSAKLVHPSLGETGENIVNFFCQNQLDWVAKTWAEMCNDPLTFFKSVNSPTALLIDCGQFGYLISEKGQVLRYLFDRR
jgi:hypothetical protein